VCLCVHLCECRRKVARHGQHEMKRDKESKANHALDRLRRTWLHPAFERLVFILSFNYFFSINSKNKFIHTTNNRMLLFVCLFVCWGGKHA